ncbi:AraC family transcriptional regulator [Pelagibius sp. Alg239-R121]|uniref:AraC family transcriptional regulator n=1 Tax=Pelagibius sp. Alg239-R121 TaxID=2993448 RepID=UPI0024A6B4A4|nr:AraC family transcriptional regulator [Pelagibius sp. Alg239-R121]
MSILEKVVWYVEWRRREAFDLEDVAQACGVSRFHLSRVFQSVSGRSVMAYARARRLSEAARLLVGGADDILSVALDAGYGSHEAFTRAFRELFGITPEALRAARSLENLQLVEPIAMDASLLTDLQPPRIVDREAFRIAGLSERYSFETNHSIPDLWRRFAPHFEQIPNQIGKTSYGICFNGDAEGNFDYMAGVEVGSAEDENDGLARITVPAQRYAVFIHSGHISDIRKTVYSIWNKWLPEAEVSHAGGPDFELYDERFDGTTGRGEVEIWVPVR